MSILKRVFLRRRCRGLARSGRPLGLVSVLLAGSLVYAACSGVPVGFKTSNEKPFSSLQAFQDSVRTLAALPDTLEGQRRLDALWDTLAWHQHIPLVIGDSVAFLYKGDADSVRWQGTFNDFGRAGFVPNRGRRLGGSDVWILQTAFPDDARIKYWIEIDDGRRLPDPANIHHVWLNMAQQVSDLRMPKWKPSAWVERQPDVPRGLLSDNRLIESTALGYAVHYRVYTPASYEDLHKLPTLYITDGHAYAHDRGVGMVVVLDNLIARKKLRPVIAVFIDPRHPDNPGINRRQAEFKMNPQYAQFVADELVPAIDQAYRTAARAEHRAILGYSFGGLNAAYLGIERPDVFLNVAMQSPALHGNVSIYQRYAQTRIPITQRFYITTGTLMDTEMQADPLVAILEERGATYTYIKVREGHSLASWRHQLADLLRYFWRR